MSLFPNSGSKPQRAGDHLKIEFSTNLNESQQTLSHHQTPQKQDRYTDLDPKFFTSSTNSIFPNGVDGRVTKARAVTGRAGGRTDPR